MIYSGDLDKRKPVGNFLEKIRLRRNGAFINNLNPFKF